MIIVLKEYKETLIKIHIYTYIYKLNTKEDSYINIRVYTTKNNQIYKEDNYSYIKKINKYIRKLTKIHM